MYRDQEGDNPNIASIANLIQPFKKDVIVKRLSRSHWPVDMSVMVSIDCSLVWGGGPAHYE